MTREIEVARIVAKYCAKHPHLLPHLKARKRSDIAQRVLECFR